MEEKYALEEILTKDWCTVLELWPNEKQEAYEVGGRINRLMANPFTETMHVLQTPASRKSSTDSSLGGRSTSQDARAVMEDSKKRKA